MLDINEVQSRANRVNRLLVVDDDPVAGGMAKLRLEDLGFEVDSVESGEEALDLLGRLKPDVVFLDVSMPGISGMQVLERIRTWRMDTAVIMMTAYGSEEVAIDALRRGADDYLGKPFESDELGTVLERTIVRLELKRQNTALRHRLEDERARASFIRDDTLPQEAPEVEGFDLAARLVPAHEVGGGFYSWMNTEGGGLSFTLGDAASKGVPAAFLTSTVGAALRVASYQNPPGEAISLASRALKDNMRADANYVTLFHAQLDPETRRVGYVDAGHEQVFVRRASGETESLVSDISPFGLIPGEGYAESSVVLEPGDALVAYSKGFFEARSSGLGLDVVSEVLAQASSADEMVDLMIGLAQLESLPRNDLTVMALYCRP